MITVSIAINGTPILTRSAVRIEGRPGESCVYRVDDGMTIQHDHDDGAVALVNKLLDCIVEPRQPREDHQGMRPAGFYMDEGKLKCSI